MAHNIHPKIINIIAKIYTNDRLQTHNYGFKIGKFTIPILYSADDGLLLTHSIAETKESTQELQRVAQDYGLIINSDKSNIIMINEKERPTSIEDIQIFNDITYLGVKITIQRNCCRAYKNERINKASQLGDMTYSVTARCCNRLLIGKNYWKEHGLATVLYAAETQENTEEDLTNLQRIENLCQATLQVLTCTSSSALRGEVGATSNRARGMKIRILFAKC